MESKTSFSEQFDRLGSFIEAASASWLVRFGAIMACRHSVQLTIFTCSSCARSIESMSGMTT